MDLGADVVDRLYQQFWRLEGLPQLNLLNLQNQISTARDSLKLYQSAIDDKIQNIAHWSHCRDLN